MSEKSGKLFSDGKVKIGKMMKTIEEKEFPLEKERVKYLGLAEKANSFMLNEQLLDENLWKIFVRQFIEKKDGEKGWWRGEFFGKMMRGACLTYRYTHSEELYSVLKKAVIEFLSVQDESGRFSTYTKETEFTGWDMWGRKYAMLGLLYFYDICKDRNLKSEIISALTKHADYITANVGEGKKHPIAFATSFWQHAGLPSCSVLEPFVKLYKIVKKQSYLDFAKQIIDTGFTNNEDNLIEIFYKKEKKISELLSKKAYEMMSCFQGLLEYYEVTGEEKYLISVKNFVNAVIETELTEIGALGTDYEFFGDSVETQTEYRERPMLETCVTVTFMNLCYKMLEFTGEPRFAELIERSAYNAMFGAINYEKNKTVYKFNNGKPELIETNYFIPIDSYSPITMQRRAVDFAGCMQLTDDGMKYGCCTCISSAGTAISALYGIMKINDGYAINGFENCKATLYDVCGEPFDIEITGKPFEKDESVKIKLTGGTKNAVLFKIRVPEWSAKTTVLVKGDKSEICRKQDCSEYFTVKGVFDKGEEIEIIPDTRVYAVKRNGKVLLKKCGVVLARDERYEDGFDNPADVAINGDGTVNAERIVTKKFNAVAEFMIPQNNGKGFVVCDYASAGKKWDEGKNLRVSAWL